VTLLVDGITMLRLDTLSSPATSILRLHAQVTSIASSVAGGLVSKIPDPELILMSAPLAGFPLENMTEIARLQALAYGVDEVPIVHDPALLPVSFCLHADSQLVAYAGVVDFYRKAGGWQPASEVVLTGNAGSRALASDTLGLTVMLELFSEHARDHAASLLKGRIILGLPEGQFR
jgi:hypothetical protein